MDNFSHKNHEIMKYGDIAITGIGTGLIIVTVMVIALIPL